MNTSNDNEFELLWKEQDEQLEKSMRLNEKLLKTINMKNAADDFAKLLQISLLGRNLAFVFFLIAATLSFLVLKDFKISIPGLLAAGGMLGSFIYHLSYTVGLTADDYHSASVIDFQKKINHFKLRAMAAAKYDLVITITWFVALFPLIVTVIFHKDLYEHFSAVKYWGISLILLLVSLPINQKMYQIKYRDQLSRAEEQLQEVIDFETNKTTSLKNTPTKPAYSTSQLVNFFCLIAAVLLLIYFAREGFLFGQWLKNK
jgi:hypothetical protein